MPFFIPLWFSSGIDCGVGRLMGSAKKKIKIKRMHE
jgi:hypothetical protein